MLFVFTKMLLGDKPTIDWLAKVIPLGCQMAVGENCGWLNERAKARK